MIVKGPREVGDERMESKTRNPKSEVMTISQKVIRRALRAIICRENISQTQKRSHFGGVKGLGEFKSGLHLRKHHRGKEGTSGGNGGR